MKTSPDVQLRPVTDQDHSFLLGLYRSVREPELAVLDWPAEAKDDFVRQQFEAQQQLWEQYHDTRFDLVLVDGVPAGRLYVGRWKHTVRIADIALLPQYRGTGLGTRLMEAIFAEADAAGLPVSIHVEKFNPARRLYERLGFREKEDKGIYLLMERPLRAASDKTVS